MPLHLVETDTPGIRPWGPKEALAGKPFEYTATHGTLFKADRSDLVGGVDVYVPSLLTEAQLAQDLFETGRYHAKEVGYSLSNFNPAAVEYRIIRA